MTAAAMSLRRAAVATTWLAPNDVQLSGPIADHPDVARAEALPASRYPRLIEIAKAAKGLGPDREFRAGLDIVMTGLAARRSGGPEGLAR